MPIDHDAAATIVGVPFSHEVLVPGAELLRVRGAGRGSFAPDVNQPFAEDGVDDFADRGAELVFGDVTAADIEQVLIVGAGLPALMRLIPAFDPNP